jgi:UDP-3-O-[3-hydroxymyristoyl] glucosamine N-acyltransferase
MSLTTAEIADKVGGRLYGNPNQVITDVSSAEKAGPQHVTFARGVYVEYLSQMKAGVIIIDEDAGVDPEKFEQNIIVCDDARRAFGDMVAFFHPEPHYEPGIHPTAVISPSAKIDPSATVMAYCVIDDDAVIGKNCVLFPYVYVGKKAVLGEGCEINPGAVIHENSILGDRVVLRAHAVIGGQGFGFSTDEQGHHTHIRQLGNVVLGNDVEIGAGSTVDNSAMNSTLVGRGTKIDNLVHLGHNVEVGEDCFLCAQVGVAGSTTVGNHCILAGQVGVTGHIHITDNVILGGKTGVTGNIKKPGTYVGYPARPHGEWGRTQVLIGRLPEIRKKIRRLEKLLEEKK